MKILSLTCSRTIMGFGISSFDGKKYKLEFCKEFPGVIINDSVIVTESSIWTIQVEKDKAADAKAPKIKAEASK